MRGLSHSHTRERKAAGANEEYRSAMGHIACLDGDVEDSYEIDKDIMCLYYQGYDLDSIYIMNGEICIDEYV